MSIVTLAAISVAGVSCLQLEQPVLIESLSGDEIVFGADAHIEAQTKASSGTTETTSLTSFYVSAVTGSAGSESSAWTSTQFTQVTGSSPATYKGAKMWPASNPSYKFYASNRPLTYAAGGTTVSATNTTDVVCAYLTNGTYKTKNTLTFEHIFARFGRVDVAAESGYTISNISIRITPKTGGTYNLRTGAGKTDGTGWSSVTTGSATVVANATGANANDIYLVPGTYEVKATWTATQSGTSITYTDKVVNVPIVGGKTNVVSIVLGGEILFGVDLEEYCEYNYRDNLNYLNFYCDEAGTIGWKCTNASVAKTIQYSKDQGATWTSITSTTSGVVVSVSAGDIVWFKGSNSSYGSSDYYNCFTLSNKAHVYGNVNSLTGDNTSVSAYCFRDLFHGCGSKLYTYDAKKIILPATTLANTCYQSMFSRCTSLTTAPELPATTLAIYCYAYMFYGCTSLTTAPELPATTLAEQCYRSMFEGCTSLTTAPELPATTLVSNCYNAMFSGCSSLNYIKAFFTTTPSLSYTRNWVSDVAATGTFVKNANATWDVSGVNGVPTGWTLFDKNYLKFKFTTDGSVAWQNVRGDIQYSKNNGPWTTFNGTTVSMSAGDEIIFQGALTNGIGAAYAHTSSKFVTTGKFNASGDVKSLCSFSTTQKSYHFAYLFCLCSGLEDASELVLPSSSLNTACFYWMFANCVDLVAAPELNAPSLSKNCYQSMFEGCTSLVVAPALPATTLNTNCYYRMFQGCVNLIEAPELNCTSLAGSCYYQMFNRCFSLTEAPELPAVTMVSSCYYGMFSECISLVVPPELPATTLASSCYYGMFQGCSQLASAPALPASTLEASCYYSMFQSCISLTTAPDLPAETLVTNCYISMFRYCSSLNYIKALFTTTPSDSYTKNWVQGVAASGTFVKNGNASWDVTGNNGIPTGWTVKKEIKPLGRFLIGYENYSIPIYAGFSPGNLQCTIASGPDATGYNYTGTDWSFAEHQWEALGDTDGANSFTVGKKMDLFGWVAATADYDTYGLCSSVESPSVYYGTSSASLKTDWCDIPEVISNYGTGWFTLNTENFRFLLNSRQTHVTINGTDQARFTFASIRTDVSSVNGIIVFPDGYSGGTPSGVTWGDINFESSTRTQCTAAGWDALEAAGCVFFPAAGRRAGSSVYYFDESVGLWTKNPYDASNAYYASFSISWVNYNYRNNLNRSNGYSVRLAKLVD